MKNIIPPPIQLERPLERIKQAADEMGLRLVYTGYDINNHRYQFKVMEADRVSDLHVPIAFSECDLLDDSLDNCRVTVLQPAKDALDSFYSEKRDSA